MRRIYEKRAYGPKPDRGNYWRATLGHVPTSDPIAEGDLTCDIAIIGAGFTGLNAALELAAEGVDVAVFDSEHVAWGASGRNGGFCCLGGDKLGQRALVRRYGKEQTALYRTAQRAAIDLVAQNIDMFGIDADRHSDGETQLAHRPSDAEGFESEAAEMREAYGVQSTILRHEELSEHGLSGPEFFGALTVPIGFALNPLKYATGLAAAARQAGVRIFGGSPITDIRHEGRWTLISPSARIRAAKLIVATNGYSSEDLPDWYANRYLPVQSNVMVTRPLSTDELKAQGFFSHQMCYDSRTLLHYFRLMPDNRFLFGLRGAVSASSVAARAVESRLLSNFRRMFPHWETVEAPHFWTGLACIARNRVPFAGPLGDLPDAWGAMAYHGNGVAMGSYCGRLTAELALGRKTRPHPDFMQSAPRKFELGRFRRAQLRIAYAAYKWMDK